MITKNQSNPLISENPSSVTAGEMGETRICSNCGFNAKDLGPLAPCCPFCGSDFLNRETQAKSDEEIAREFDWTYDDDEGCWMVWDETTRQINRLEITAADAKAFVERHRDSMRHAIAAITKAKSAQSLPTAAGGAPEATSLLRKGLKECRDEMCFLRSVILSGESMNEADVHQFATRLGLANALLLSEQGGGAPASGAASEKTSFFNLHPNPSLAKEKKEEGQSS